MPGPAKMRRLPFGPLDEYVQTDLTVRLGRPPVSREIAERIGTTRDRYYEWRRKGIGVDRADLICQKRLHIHPSFIWNDDWWNINNSEH